MKVLDVFNSCIIGAFTFAAQIEFVFRDEGVIYFFDIDVGKAVLPRKKIFGVFKGSFVTF
jgi:hypothetical protein